MTEIAPEQPWQAWVPLQHNQYRADPYSIPRLDPAAVWLARPDEKLSLPGTTGQSSHRYDVHWRAPSARARRLRPLFLDWPPVYETRLAALGDVYSFTSPRSGFWAGIPARYVGAEAVTVIADAADFRRWDAARNTFLQVVKDIDGQIRPEWLPHGQKLRRSWWLPRRRRAWQRSMENRFERLRAAYEPYRVVLPEIEAAVRTTAQAKAEVTAALRVVHDWYGRTYWLLVRDHADQVRMVRHELASGGLRLGLLGDVRSHASSIRRTDHQAVVWDQPSLDLCARELRELSAELPLGRYEKAKKRSGQPAWRWPAETASGQPMIYLRPATFAAVYRLRFGSAVDELTNPRQLEKDRLLRRANQERETSDRPTASNRGRVGGSWPTDAGGGGGHAGGDHGGGGYGGGHSGGFGGSF